MTSGFGVKSLNFLFSPSNIPNVSEVQWDWFLQEPDFQEDEYMYDDLDLEGDIGSRKYFFIIIFRYWGFFILPCSHYLYCHTVPWNPFDQGCVRLGNPDLDFESRISDFAIEREFHLLEIRPQGRFQLGNPNPDFMDFLFTVRLRNLKKDLQNCSRGQRSSFC